MVIVDVHAHIFEKFAGITNGEPIQSEGYGKVKIGNQIAQFLPPSFENSNSTVETLINYMDWCGIDKALLLQNVIYGYHNEYCHKAVNLYPDRLKAAALVDVVKGNKAADELYNLVRNNGFCGLKIEVNSIFQCMRELALDDKVLEPIWDCCNDLYLPVILHLSRPDDIGSLKNIIERYKKAKFIICHMGAEAALTNNTSSKNHLDTLLEIISKNPNVWVDISAVPCYWAVAEDYPFASSCALIEEAYSILGPEKILWGSDYPGTLLIATYKQLIDFVRKDCTRIPEKHREMILGKNAIDLFWV